MVSNEEVKAFKIQGKSYIDIFVLPPPESQAQVMTRVEAVRAGAANAGTIDLPHDTFFSLQPSGIDYK